MIVMPTYNESENIASTIMGCLKVFEECGIDGAVLVIDDSSPDGTAKIAYELAKRTGRVYVMVRPAKLGIGSAYVDGFKEVLRNHGEVKVVVEMDADGSHDPRYLPVLIGPVVKGDADVVVGSRYVPGGGWEVRGLRYVVSRVANFCARTSTGLHVRDVTSGYRSISSDILRDVVGSLYRSPRSYVFQAASLLLYASRGARILEVPIRFEQRRKGKSKLRFDDVVTFAGWCLRSFIERSHHSRRSIAPP